MATTRLPDDPSLEQLRKQAKDLRDGARAGASDSLELIAAHHPKGPHPVTLSGAQLVVARHYGFSSWPQLKSHVETVERFRRAPDQVNDPKDLPEQFLLLACLRYGRDDIANRWQRANQLLADDQSISRSSVHAAAATANEAALAELLAADPGGARRPGGPYGWEPLLYLAYARHDPAISEAATLGAARLLLAHGADPNAGYLWHGLIPPFTALTGAFGSGEGDQPQHPHGLALARLLLEAGADPNDGQALYNRQFGADNGHLVLLFEYGLGQGDGGPWRARLGHRMDTPEAMVRKQLWWAIVHGMRDRVTLLADHGADIHTPFVAPNGRPSWARTHDGRTPAELAALAGCPELVECLVDRGATRPSGDDVDGLIAAALNNDRDKVRRLGAHLDEARARHPALIVWAAARGKTDAVALLAELGFDVNARGRGDVPMEQPWETALHHAASSGDVALATRLLTLGANPDLKDARFDATPLGWARHFGRQAMVDLLEPLTSTG